MPTQRDYMIATVLGEDNLGSAQGQAAIIDSIFNRQAAILSGLRAPGYYESKSSSIKDIVTANGGNQYNTWKGTAGEAANAARASRALQGRDAVTGAERAQYDQIAKIYDEYMAGQGGWQGISQGATFYQTPKSAADGSFQNKFYGQNGGNNYQDIGSHRFSGEVGQYYKDKNAFYAANPQIYNPNTGAGYDPSSPLLPGSDRTGPGDYFGIGDGSLGRNGSVPPYLGPGLSYDASGSASGGIGSPNFGAGITPDAYLPMPSNYAAIGSLYQHDVGRAPDANGLNYWGKELTSGRSLFDIEQGIRGSAEGQAYLSKNPRDQLIAMLTPTLPPGSPTNPVGPPGISGTIGAGPTQYPVGPGSPTYPIGPNGEQISPVGPGAAVGPVGPGQAQYPIGPDGFEVGAVPPGQAGGQVAPPPSQGALGPGAESQPVGPEGYGANPVGPPALTPAVPGPGLTPAVPAPNAVHAFDGGEYLAANPDVAASGMNAWDHYARFGYGEGRAIDAAGDRLPQGFSGNAYLAANRDVALSGMNPLEHFAKYGVAEGRAIAPYGFSGANVSGNVGPGTWNGTFDAASYLAANPDVAAAGAQALPHFLQFGLNEGRALDTAGHHLSQNFDGNAYLAQNQDVARAGMNPLEHYLEHGAAEGRAAPTGVTPWSFSGANVSQGLGPIGNGSFSGRFSAADYLAANRDVASSGMNAEDHYLRYGFGEGRALDTAGHRINQGFDPTAYLAQNQDVAAAKLDPLKHFLDFGAAEGRAAPTGGNPYQFSNFNVAGGAGPTGNGAFGISGITSSAPGGMGSAPSQGSSNPLPAFGSNLNVSGGVGNGAFGLGGFAPADQSSSTASWESAAPNALPGSGGAGGSAFAYTDNRGQQQIATFDPQKSENAYLAGQVAQNQQQIEAGRASVANNPNLWNFGATNLLNSVAASNYQPGPIYSTATGATAALPSPVGPTFNSPLPVMQQGLQVNPAGGFGLISAF